MAQLNLSAIDMQLLMMGNFTKFLNAIRNAVEKHDYDSGWIAVPASNTFNHRLGVLPSHIHVYGSVNANGSNYQTMEATNVNSTSLVVSGNLAYYRVIADR